MTEHEAPSGRARPATGKAFEDLFATVDVVKAILALMDEAAGPKTLDEMHPDPLIPMSNGYSNWFTSPEIARLGTAGLRPSEIAERVVRYLDGARR